MRIIDLKQEYESLYFVCLEDWSEEMQEAGDHKQCWYNRMKDQDLRVKLALDEDGNVGGMIQYVPVEHSFVEGHDLYVILCIWIHGYKKGRGNYQKRGMGQALLKAAEKDAEASGAGGIAAWGLSLPVWMKASWFKKQGYTKADKQGIRVLMWKSFKNDAVPPRWIKVKKCPEAVPGKVTVTAYQNGWCPAQNIVFERARRAASEIGDPVEFVHIDTFDHENFLKYGIADALFIDSKEVRTGPPPTYKKIRRLISKRVKRLN